MPTNYWHDRDMDNGTYKKSKRQKKKGRKKEENLYDENTQ